MHFEQLYVTHEQIATARAGFQIAALIAVGTAQWTTASSSRRNPASALRVFCSEVTVK